jgi:hypothetical protein
MGASASANDAQINPFHPDRLTQEVDPAQKRHRTRRALPGPDKTKARESDMHVVIQLAGPILMLAAFLLA